jgi:hypothetical protein
MRWPRGSHVITADTNPRVHRDALLGTITDEMATDLSALVGLALAIPTVALRAARRQDGLPDRFPTIVQDTLGELFVLAIQRARPFRLGHGFGSPGWKRGGTRPRGGRRSYGRRLATFWWSRQST